MTSFLATSGGRELWYLTRSTGIVTLVLLSGAVAIGVASSGTWETRNWPRFVTQGLHRNLSLLALLFLFLHVMTTVVDGYVPIGWANAVVPFTAPYKRLWLGLGAVACDLILALVVTSLIRRRLPISWWRGVHWLAYVSWPVAMVHGLGTGTDATTVVFRWTAATCALLVTSAVVWRLARRVNGTPVLRATSAGSLVLTLLLAAFGLAGGFRPATGTDATGITEAAPAAPSLPIPTVPLVVTPAAPPTTTPTAPRSTVTEPPTERQSDHAAPAQPGTVPNSGAGTGDDGATEPTTTPTTTAAPTTSAPPSTTTTTERCGLFGCSGGGGGDN
jgi:sulfoxide reductase heme-binding subunit YedZ